MSHHQAHTQPQTVEPSHTHMLPPHQDMKPSPMKLNQPQMVEMLHMLAQSQAMEDHQHTPNKPQLDIPTVFQLPTSLKLLQMEELSHTLMQLKQPHTVDKLHISLKPHQMVELIQRQSQAIPHLTVALLQSTQEQPAMEDILHQQSCHQPVHHMSHLQSHTQHQMVEPLHTHMLPHHQDMKLSPM